MTVKKLAHVSYLIFSIDFSRICAAIPNELFLFFIHLETLTIPVFVILFIQREVPCLEDIIAIFIFSAIGLSLLSVIAIGGYVTVKQQQHKQKELEIELLRLENEAFMLLERKAIREGKQLEE